MGIIKSINGALKDVIFTEPETRKSVSRLEMLTTNQNAFFSRGGKLYSSDLIQSCIKPTVAHVSKLEPLHKMVGHSEDRYINPRASLRHILQNPNEMMTMQLMLERIVWDLELNGNSFVHIRRNGNGEIDGLFHIQPITVEALQDTNNIFYLKFYFGNGTTRVLPYDQVIHIRGAFHTHDFFADSPVDALVQLMDVIDTTDQGIIHAIKNNAVVNWIMKFHQVLRTEDVEAKVKEVREKFLSVDSGGVVGVDSKFDLEQVKNDNKFFIPETNTQEIYITRVMNFFQTNEKIISGTYNEDEFQAWYAQKIEPIAKQLSDQFTLKLFTARERGHGNEIVFDTASFAHASAKTKLNLINLIDRSVISIQEYRKILNLPEEIEGITVIRKEYGSLEDVVINPRNNDGELIRNLVPEGGAINGEDNQDGEEG